jgi:hypothetical protein
MQKEQERKRNSQILQRKVRVTLELPSKFVGLLNAKMMLSGYLTADELDAGQLIEMLVCLEARGAPPEEIWAKTPMMWRDEYGPVILHDKREVIDEAALGIPEEFNVDGLIIDEMGETEDD